MSNTTAIPMNEIPPRPHNPFRLRRGIRAMRELIAVPDDTAKAQDFALAVGGASEEWRFQRFVRSAEGARLLRERPSLVDALSDREHLASLPESSFGAAYLRYLDGHDYQPASLLELRRDVEAEWVRRREREPLDSARTWFRDRVQLTHDLFHVLTGYGTDGIGEATLLVFCRPHMGGGASSLLVFGAALEAWRLIGNEWLRYARETHRRALRAGHLLGQHWEELLPQPLAHVRESTGVGAPEVAHPRGILRGEREEAGDIRVERS